MNTGKMIAVAFLAALITMVFIFLWKKLLSKYNVPFLSTVAQEV
jgi:hypothetical protein